MAKLNRWTSPLHITQTSCSVGRDANVATVTLHVRGKRWHPALWWMGLRMVEPRDWWRPAVWLALYRVTRALGQ